VITTSSMEEVHPVLLIVQRSVLAPMPIPVTPEVGEEGSAMAAVPEITDHIPVPKSGVFPASVVVDPQMNWSGPASAVVRLWELVMITSSLDAVQPLALIVHRSVLLPAPIPVTPEAGEEGFVIVAVPEINDHIPVPNEGVFPASVAVEVQMSWSGPASAAVTFWALVIITSSVDGVQFPLLIVHRSVFVPIPIPVTPEVGEEGVVMVAVPEITDQAPVPAAGIFPASVAPGEQML
jgi:hypothetical protein